MATSFKSSLVTCAVPAAPPLTTHILFDNNHLEPNSSPIDQFLERLHSINRLSPNPSQFDPLQGQLVLLGVIAAVESYLRTLLRKIISCDEASRHASYKRDISFGAAIHLHKDMMPEAILERVSFISKESILSSIKDCLGVKGHTPTDVESSIDEYVKVCHLRHCAVHRFGRLGASNAFALGIQDHYSLLEKPLILDYLSLQTAIAICTNLVKTINNFIFNELLSRIPDQCWQGNYAKDKKLFKPYYDIFADSVSSSGYTLDMKDLYIQLTEQRRRYLAGEAGRGIQAP
ncbi:hypothetical protein Q7C30_007095 [Pseudomonas sp. RAC1]|uniref:hypothetical protein n=1 Tax=Pseudomonas sp. RAC1 TaxID=3064900 RepID=UPI002722F664|nr:hypothetical protein [Pseudomonas sp. RAC1]MDV9031861.1 hypothetical protein [Pseudomonas sp. RAC1]